ncbi:ATP F0F1 synthase subunit I [Erwinia sp. OLTSP20]|uniref:F0F1 ATP synthase subunit I n=1 Tax=unclassified Erwinia TaxID=2622719 RepID=UPI000C18475A|nr:MULTISPECIES: F0F1 ATP synthase subunit I [unclassified Erwinia]PIJ49586.1 ATP F0F1 synthase subunit I [Erwinia sp. OAMSP11]PIJ72284.1 ATP F0F1 synthase subunit I [Erwinia sp. OLSSP12]PIJ81643.1 ATP F0F1 synthase subunit I [Erwinia sp. OLCASP19]PIJ82031.1 ATP F0F1 synthase subunit I [Erwinia sp. OLMTSP26]PIJ84200.1 ATP F0F1 synthase subunit I [Erwinia sp. OLMDSP33]
MSVPLFSRGLTRTLLSTQLVTVIISGALFYAFKGVTWGASALAGGVAAWLPNVVFVILAWRLQGQSPVKGRIAWTFALGEAGKVLLTMVLLIVALGSFNAVFIPLGLTWLSVLVVQIVAPAVINNKG